MQISIGEFVRLHEERMAEFVANNCKGSPVFDEANVWYLDHNLNCAYGAIEETKDNHPAFVLEWAPFVGPHYVPVCFR